MSAIIGIDWGSTALTARLIAPDGDVVDCLTLPDGITKVDRQEIGNIVRQLAARWPTTSNLYLSGMVGSASGWKAIPYVDCPAAIEDIAHNVVTLDVAGVRCVFVPGLACIDPAGSADVMRGEEVETFGFIADNPSGAEMVVALPGTHTKWVRTSSSRVVEFFTSMSSEIFDVLARDSLLSPFLNHPAERSDIFMQGVAIGSHDGGGLARLMFGVRAQVLLEQLAPGDAPSYLRGILIGAEIADACKRFPMLRGMAVPLIGNAALCRLYNAALGHLGVAARLMVADDVTAAGYLALHRALHGGRL